MLHPFKVRQWLGLLRIILAVFMQVIREPKELVQVLHVTWDWPFLESLYLFWVCSYTMCTHYAAQYRYLGDPYDALLQVNVQLDPESAAQRLNDACATLFRSARPPPYYARIHRQSNGARRHGADASREPPLV